MWVELPSRKLSLPSNRREYTVSISENPPNTSTLQDDHARRVRSMFAGIAGRYDFLNHLLSGNTDKRWRRLVADKLRPALGADSRALDVACGTGDLTLALGEAGEGRIVGVDFCRPMLEIAARKPATNDSLYEATLYHFRSPILLSIRYYRVSVCQSGGVENGCASARV